MSDLAPTPTAAGISPERSASRWWERAALLWKGLVKFTFNLVGVLIFAAIIALLIHFLTQRTIAIEPISVPRQLADNGYTPEVAARRLRDALNKYAQDANTPVISYASRYAGDANSHMGGPALTLRGELPEFVVPTVGLSLEGVVAYVRTFLRDTRRRNISGEITVVDNKLRLRLRENGIVFYSSADDIDGVDLKNPDSLFVAAVPKIFEVTEPYYNAVMLSQTDPMKGLEMAKRIIADWPDSDQNVIRSHNLVGSILQDKRRLDEAIAEYQNAIALDPSFATAHYNLGTALYAQGNFNEAIAEYQKIIKSDSHFASAHDSLGDALDAQGETQGKTNKGKAEWDLAIVEYRKIVTRDPGNATAHYNYGVALRDRGESEQAIDEFKKTIGLNPRHTAAHYNLGVALLNQDKINEAIDKLQEAVQLDSHNAVAHYRLALALHRRGNADRAKVEFETAMAEYRRLIELDARDATAYTNRGQVLFDAGDLFAAIAHYTKALEIEPHYLDAVANRGYANFAVAHYDAAVSDLLDAVRRRPTYAYYVLWLYLARVRAGQPSAAPELQAAAAKLNHQSWPYHVVELYLGSRTPEARTPEATLAAANNDDERCEAQFYIGEWHLLRGDRAAAAKPLNAAAASCQISFIESTGAWAELRRLGQ